MSANVIGLGGVAFAGKDAVADYLTDEFEWAKLYMSQPLETALLRVDPWVSITEKNWEPKTYPSGMFASTQWMRYSELHSLAGYAYSKNCLDVRNYLQKLGTEVGRNMFSQNVWTDIAFSGVDKLTNEGCNVAITGIRFPNELEAIRQRRGLAVWVERPGYTPVNTHSSDNTLHKEDFDVAIHNVGSLDDLYNATRIVVEGLDRANIYAATANG